VRTALAWLVRQKDSQGTWHSTQATVLALKALLAGTGKPLGGDQARHIEIQLDGRTVRTLAIPADQAEVVQHVDLTAEAAPGQHRLTITDRDGQATNYQATLRYHLPGPAIVEKDQPLAIRVVYDKTQLRVADTAQAAATLVNHMPQAAPMVILDLPIPAGFAVEPDDFAKLVSAGRIAKYQLTPRSVVVYLRNLEPGQPLELRYRLRALMPVKITIPGARAYEYYNPDRQAASPSVAMTVLSNGATP
jgi:CD109 antigen